MKVCEVFTSIQGESTLQGVPTVFVRLAGCNLDCGWCDTPYARTGGTDMADDAVLAAIIGSGVGTVCITGGEPLLQPDAVATMASACLERGLSVSIETNGSLDASILPHGAHRIIDIKCPSSGVSGTTHPANLTDIRPSDEFKFVVADRADFQYAHTIATAHELFDRATVLLAPVCGRLAPHLLADWLVTDMPRGRLNLQLHRVIWPLDERGR